MKVLILIFLLVFLSACHSARTEHPSLARAEQIMKAHPDSALSLLENIRQPETLSAKEYATWCLLVTQAQDKNYRKHTSDSVINVAVEYFEKRKDSLLFAKALYYKGRVFQDQDNIEEATRLFVKALDVGKDCQDYNMLFLISSRLGTLYGYQDLAGHALKSYQRACQYAVLSGDSSCLSYAYSYMGRAYGMQNDWENAIKSYKKGEDIALSTNNKSALSLSLSECAAIYIQIRSFDKAKECINRIITNVQDENLKGRTKVYLEIGNLYRLMSRYDSATVYLQKALLYENLYTKQSVYQCLYYLYEEQQNYEKAIYYNNLYWANTDSINKISNKEVILEVESKYNHEKLEKENSLLLLDKERKAKRALCSIVIFLFLLSVIIIIYQRRLLKKDKEVLAIRKELDTLTKESEKNEKSICMNQKKIDSLVKLLDEKKKELEDTANLELEKNNLIKENTALKGRNEKLQRDIQSKLILLSQRDEEFAAYKKNMEKKETIPNILVRLNKEKDVLQENDWEELELMVNVVAQDFNHRLLKNYPMLSINDIRFCSLIKLGYTLTDISVFLGVQEEAVLKRKQRIKKRIDVSKKWKKGEFDAYIKSF